MTAFTKVQRYRPGEERIALAAFLGVGCKFCSGEICYDTAAGEEMQIKPILKQVKKDPAVASMLPIQYSYVLLRITTLHRKTSWWGRIYLNGR